MTDLPWNRHVNHICLEHGRIGEWAVLFVRLQSELVASHRRAKVENYWSFCCTVSDCNPGQLRAGLLLHFDVQHICDLEVSLSLDVVDGQFCCLLTLLDTKRGWDWVQVHISGTHWGQQTDLGLPVVWISRFSHDPDGLDLLVWPDFVP